MCSNISADTTRSKRRSMENSFMSAVRITAWLRPFSFRRFLIDESTLSGGFCFGAAPVLLKQPEAVQHSDAEADRGIRDSSSVSQFDQRLHG